MKIDKELHDVLCELTEASIHIEGKEHCNPKPMIVDVGPARLSLQEQIKRILHSERLKYNAQSQGYESFDEANDFDVPDEDPVPMSGFEYEEMKPEIVEKQPAVVRDPGDVEKGNDNVDLDPEVSDAASGGSEGD